MVQYDYNPQGSPTQQQLVSAKFLKKEEHELPAFAKEVPLRTIVRKHGNNVTVEYEWNVLGGETIKIQFMSYKGDSKLENVHRIKIVDGQEVGAFKIDNTTYIIRKTTEDIAKSLLKTGKKIKASFLEVIGYLKTVKGNIYSISKIEGEAWSLDSRLGLKTFSLKSMDEASKRKFVDLIIEELLKLARAGYSLKNFSLMDIIVTKKKIVFGNMTALIRVEAARKVDSFISNLKVIVKSGIAQKSDIVYGIALSFGAMRKEYTEWAKENNISDKEDVHIFEKIEQDILR